MKPLRERSDSVGTGELGGISTSLRAHRNEGLRPASDECWVVDQDSRYARSECISLLFQIFLTSSPPRSSVSVG